jgi:uncharacterized membrane protein YhaH (DUF805 family)
MLIMLVFFGLFFGLNHIHHAPIAVVILRLLVDLVVVVASFAIAINGIFLKIARLHDRNYSGWWLLLLLIPLVGAIIMFVWSLMEGTLGANRFGEPQKPGFQYRWGKPVLITGCVVIALYFLAIPFVTTYIVSHDPKLSSQATLVAHPDNQGA